MSVSPAILVCSLESEVSYHTRISCGASRWCYTHTLLHTQLQTSGIDSCETNIGLVTPEMSVGQVRVDWLVG